MVKDLINMLGEFEDKKILVIGDIMLDRFIWGNCERINPEEEGAQLVKVKNQNYMLGGAANVANNITSLGGSCDLWGCVGDGINGKKVKKLCEDNYINLNNFYDKYPTIVKTRIMAGKKQLVRFDLGEDNLKKIDKNIERNILNYLTEKINDYDFIVLSDYDKSLFGKGLSYNIINLANQKEIKTLADIKPKNSNSFKKCTIICPNKEEAEKMTGIDYSPDKKTLVNIGEAIIDEIKSKYAVITCGEEGAFLYSKNGNESKLIPTRAKEIADVTGAGDTFAAAIALGMTCETGIEHVIELANYAAGIVCGKAGTATTSSEELKEYILKEEK